MFAVRSRGKGLLIGEELWSQKVVVVVVVIVIIYEVGRTSFDAPFLVPSWPVVLKRSRPSSSGEIRSKYFQGAERLFRYRRASMRSGRRVYHGFLPCVIRLLNYLE